MDKNQQTKEIDRLLNKAVALREKAELDLTTAVFLDNEAIKLEAIVDNPKTLPEEKESAMIKLEALNHRILIELNEKSNEQEKLEKELNDFIKGLSNE
jgi:hypothetical protein